MRFVTHSRYDKIRPRRFLQDNSDHAGAKPNGIWFSVIVDDGVDGWAKCREANGEKPHLHRLELSFTPEAKICWLQNEEDIDAFNARFGNYPDPDLWAASPGNRRPAIRWDGVAQHYDAVIAAPYCKARVDRHWYGAFEFASGCVWHLDKIECRKLV